MTMCVEERGIKYLEQIYNYKSTYKLQEFKSRQDGPRQVEDTGEIRYSGLLYEETAK